MTAAQHTEPVDLATELDRLYPGRLALLLIALCSPTRPHEHRGRPCESPGKVPLATRWNEAAFERRRNGDGREAHLAQAARHVVNGGNVGLVVPPGVLVLDADTPEAVRALEAVLGDAPRQETAHGSHYIVRAPENLVVKSTVGLEIVPGVRVDLRSAGSAQIVVEPSIHATGAAYCWKRSLPEDLAELLELPAEWLERVTAPRSRTNGSGAISEGQRNAELFRIAAGMRGRGGDEHAIFAELLRVNAERCTDPLGAEEVEGIAASACRYEVGEPPPVVRVGADLAERLTDLGNARRLVRHYGADLRYRHDAGAWLVWDGRRWATDGTGEVVRRAKAITTALYSEAAAATSQEAREALGKWALRSEGLGHIGAMVELAQSELGVPVRAEGLDRDPYALNVLNGTLDLRCGVLWPHRREDLLTKLAPVEYDAKAGSKLWKRFLETAIPDAEARRFAQKAAGYSLLGRTGADVFLVVHGPPRTGKGTFQEALASTLGDYAATAGLEDFAERKGGNAGPRPELVRLQGARLVSIYETSKRLRISASLVKTLTGSDPLTVRDLYTGCVTFAPQFTLWLATNHLPRLPDDDGAIWERVRELPFDAVIPEAERDPKVRAELSDPQANGAAILAWAVEGCRLYLEEGLQAPELVRQATADYRAAMDPLRDFFEACCAFGTDLWVRSADLSAAYETWCKDSGEKRIADFNERLRARGCEPGRRHSGRGWNGIGLLEIPRTVTP